MGRWRSGQSHLTVNQATSVYGGSNPSLPTERRNRFDVCNGMQKRYKAIVFDFGGVIEISRAGNVIHAIAESIPVPVDVFREEYFKHNHLSNVANISWEDMVLKVVSVFDVTKETKENVLSIIRDYQSKKEINSELVSFFPILRGLGYKVAIFSNATSRLREELDKNGILKLVDSVIISGEIGFQKPHKEAFDVLFEKLGVTPEEVIFIDDTPKSLEKSIEIGYSPILFTDNGQLRIDLQKLGITV